MRQIKIFFFVCFMIFAAGSAQAGSSLPQSEEGEDLFQEYTKISRDRFFVIETDEESARSSLDRIYGDIDRGFAPKENTYESRNHGINGPTKGQKDETFYY